MIIEILKKRYKLELDWVYGTIRLLVGQGEHVFGARTQWFESRTENGLDVI